MTAYTAVALANAAVALVSGVSSILGMTRPALLTHEGAVTSGTMFFAWAYGARALPLSVVMLVMLAANIRQGLVPILVIAGLAQIGDAAIGAVRGNRPMVISCLVLTAIHLPSAWWLAVR
ncbi:hypothetical protein [Nocardia pseudobrasiliensis]|uniref:DoxX-like protein n=1 Tax=Nocardia pseudobrasiliensis TaxID=45979 RepID=A0A370HZ38_9NOCA|nr:hypothetical protein [Nocardia pseudobrasiliensis]RDI63777.1 hypothetical protein DFR76_109115 [Nocardia pseudobrasiliensis]